MTARKLNEIIRPNIFEFHDYREFIRAWFEYMGEKSPSFSVRSLAKEADLSHNFFHITLQGKRALKIRSAEKFVHLIGLHKDEINYLYLLIDMAEQKDPKKQEEAFQGIKRIRRFKKYNLEEFEVLEYLSSWHYMAIREMVVFPNFEMNPKWIQTRLKEKVTIKEIRKAMDFLEKHKFVVYDKQGKAYLPDKPIVCHEGMFRVALTKFHKHMLDQAKRSIDINTREERKQVSYALALSQDTFEEAKAIIDEAKNRINELASKDEKLANAVYYVNFSAFPMARDKD